MAEGNKVDVIGELMEPPYLGNAKAGPYASVKIKIPDGQYAVRTEVYAPGPASVELLGGCAAGDKFRFEGSLTQRKRGDAWILQIKAEKVSRVPGF